MFKKISALLVTLLILISLPVSAFADKLVIIDPGHGGKYSGTLGFSGAATGYYEKHANLSVALKLRDQLEAQGYNVKMTRTTDRHFSGYSQSSDLKARMKIANNYAKGNHNNSLFISIHHNSLPPKPSTRGYETYYYNINNGYSQTYPPDPLQIKQTKESKRLATTIHNSVLSKTSLREGRGMIANNFFVTRNAHVPSVLVELGYMSNPYEESQIKKDTHQNEVAAALASGVNDFYRVFEVYDHKDQRLKSYLSKSSAIKYAQSREDVYVFDKYKQKKIFKSAAARYEVHHSLKGLIHDPFMTEKEALNYAKKWKNTRIINNETGDMIWSNYLDKQYRVDHSLKGELFQANTEGAAIKYAKAWKNTAVIHTKTGEIIWSNYMKPYVVEHSSQGELFASFNEKDAISYAEKWRHTSVINKGTGDIIWTNYQNKAYVVKHSLKGELFKAHSEQAAIAYAKKWKNTAVYQVDSNDVIWTNYLPKPYVVEHSLKGELFDAYTKEKAIAYAKKWKNTVVIERDTEEKLWSNYLDIK